MEKYLYEDLNNLEESHWWHISKKLLCLLLISKFSKGRDLKILDVGCGTGINILTLKKVGLVSGIDCSREAIKYCQSRGLKKVSLGNVYHTNYPDGSFDLVTLLDVLEHTDDRRSLMEINRILKKQGLLLLTVPAFSWVWSRWDVVLHHRRRYNKLMLTQVLEENGFKILKISYLYSFLLIPALLIRLVKTLFLKSYYPSDFKLSSPLINKIGLFLAAIERKIFLNYSLPFGTSLVCLAQKNEK